MENTNVMELVKTYVEVLNSLDKIFNRQQLGEITAGTRDGLSFDQIALYADAKFSDAQMNNIKYGFNAGLSMEQVKEYANPIISASDMITIINYHILKNNIKNKTRDYEDDGIIYMDEQ